MPVAAGGMAGTSSGDATSSAASTPFSPPEGSGAFKHAYAGLEEIHDGLRCNILG